MMNAYNTETGNMNYFTEPVRDGRSFEDGVEKMNESILADFHIAVEWLLNKGYESYQEVQSNTCNPAQQNAFLPLREYRVIRNGHAKTVRIYQRFLGGCWIEERKM